MFLPLDSLMHSLIELLIGLTVGALLSVLCGIALALALRLRALRWTWSVLLFPPVLLSSYLSLWLALFGAGVCVVACVAGMVWQARDLMAGGDLAEAAHARVGILEAIQRGVARWQALRQPLPWVRGGRLEVGRDARGVAMTIPAGAESGSHTLLLGATRSGKTCGQAWIAGRLVEHGRGAVVVDPKGDRLLRAELEFAAETAAVPFMCWSPSGPLAYNPYTRGEPSEIADRALCGEVFTEPHYLRQAQRYLRHAVRAIDGAGVDVTSASLVAHMNIEQLEQTAKRLPEEHQSELHEYLDSLTQRQRNDLAGVRDRLSILAESDVGPWLDPAGSEHAIDLERQVQERAVVYFSLEADRRPLLTKMLANAIVGDLAALAASMQRKPIPTVVAIDEFSGIAAEQIGKLFARGASAGMSLLLATQELADLRAAGHAALQDQVIGNLGASIDYRQNVPASAELIAAMAGTQPAWITTQHTVATFLRPRSTARGSRTRGHEPIIRPTRVKQLRTGEAVMIVPAGDQPPAIVRMHHPREAHARSLLVLQRQARRHARSEPAGDRHHQHGGGGDEREADERDDHAHRADDRVVDDDVQGAV
jgi:type IV secretory pathway TraG/TraD family ATPase VirD4